MASCATQGTPVINLDLYRVDAKNQRCCKDLGNPLTCKPLEACDRDYVMDKEDVRDIGEALVSCEYIK